MNRARTIVSRKLLMCLLLLAAGCSSEGTSGEPVIAEPERAGRVSFEGLDESWTVMPVPDVAVSRSSGSVAILLGSMVDGSGSRYEQLVSISAQKVALSNVVPERAVPVSIGSGDGHVLETAPGRFALYWTLADTSLMALGGSEPESLAAVAAAVVLDEGGEPRVDESRLPSGIVEVARLEVDGDARSSVATVARMQSGGAAVAFLLAADGDVRGLVTDVDTVQRATVRSMPGWRSDTSGVQSVAVWEEDGFLVSLTCLSCTDQDLDTLLEALTID